MPHAMTSPTTFSSPFSFDRYSLLARFKRPPVLVIPEEPLPSEQRSQPVRTPYGSAVSPKTVFQQPQYHAYPPPQQVLRFPVIPFDRVVGSGRRSGVAGAVGAVKPARRPSEVWKQAAGRFPEDERYKRMCTRVTAAVQAIRDRLKSSPHAPEVREFTCKDAHIPTRKPRKPSLKLVTSFRDISFNTVDWGVCIDTRRPSNPYKLSATDDQAFETMIEKWFVQSRGDSKSENNEDNRHVTAT